jgi:peptide/nickel transport system substrate-binding protein
VKSHRLRRRPAVAVLALTGIVALAGCTAADPTEGGGADAEKQPLVISLDSAVDILDPQQWRTPGSMVTTGGLVEQLIEQTYDEEGVVQVGTTEFSNALADSYEYDETGTVLTATLKDGLTFADGTPLTAEDVVWSYQRGLEMTSAYTKTLYAMVGLTADSFVAVDDTTVQVTAAFASPLLDKMLAMQPFGIFSKTTGEANATADDAWAGAWFKSNANSSGPYSVGQFDPTTSITLTPNEAYYDQDKLANAGVTIQFVADASQRALLLQNGEIDLAGGLQLDQVAELEDVDGLNVVSLDSNRLEYLGMNTAIAPFNDPRVRQAIALALPYETFVDEVMYGYANASTGIVPAGMETHSDAIAFEEDLAAAQALLDEAGVGPFTTSLSFKQSSAVESRAAVYIQSALAEIGIDVEINALPDAEFTQRTTARDLELYLNNFLGWGADPFYQMRSLVGTGAGTNFNNYSNPALDELILSGFATQDEGERAAISAEAQQIIFDEMPLVPIWNPDWTYVARDGVSGITKDNTEQLRLQYLTKE